MDHLAGMNLDQRAGFEALRVTHKATHGRVVFEGMVKDGWARITTPDLYVKHRYQVGFIDPQGVYHRGRS
jgi:hypothetical protein